jgi:hypothetical protein
MEQNRLNEINSASINMDGFDCDKYNRIPIIGKALSASCHDSVKKCENNFKDVPYIGSFLVSLCKYVTGSINDYEYKYINDIAKPLLYGSSIVLCIIFVLICILYIIVIYILYKKT